MLAWDAASEHIRENPKCSDKSNAYENQTKDGYMKKGEGMVWGEKKTEKACWGRYLNPIHWIMYNSGLGFLKTHKEEKNVWGRKTIEREREMLQPQQEKWNLVVVGGWVLIIVNPGKKKKKE